MLAEKCLERAVRRVTRYAATVDQQPVLPGLLAELGVMVISLARRAVALLPGVEHFMCKRAQDFPKCSAIGQVVGIESNLALEAEAIVAIAKMAVARNREGIDAEDDFRDVEFKLDVESFRPRLKLGNDPLLRPRLAPLVVGEQWIDRWFSPALRDGSVIRCSSAEPLLETPTDRGGYVELPQTGNARHATTD